MHTIYFSLDYLKDDNIYVMFFFFQFLYVNQAFAPSPDTDIGSVFDVSIDTFVKHILL